MTLRIEGQPNWTVTTPRRSRRGTAAASAPSPLPDCLRDGPFEIVEEATLKGPETKPVSATRRATRATRAAGPQVTVQLDQPADQPYVVMARQESGAISFHIPEASAPTAVRGRRSRAALPTAPLTVTIPIGSGGSAGEAPAAKARRGTRGLADRVIQVVVLKVADTVVDYAMELLARRLEARLWKEGNRQEGWVRVVLGADGAVSSRPEAPRPEDTGRSLLLLHGTFSHTLSAFGEMLGDSETAERLKALYGDRIYGFDHFSFSKTPDENVAELLATLPAAARWNSDVITHSRGGLVLRTLHRELTKGRRPDPRLTLGKVVLVASPNEGTPLATPERWEQTLGWFANLLEMFPENPFTTAAGWISGSLSWLAQKLNKNLPGIQAMDAGGATIGDLAKVPGAPGAEWSAVVADTTPPIDKGLAARLADMGVDGFFQGSNDLVVPTEGGRQWEGAALAKIPDERVGRFAKKGGNLLAPADAFVMHTTLFAQVATRTFIADVLQLPPLAAATRAVIRLPPSLLPDVVPGAALGSRQNAAPLDRPDTGQTAATEKTRGTDETEKVPARGAMTIRTEMDDQGWSRQDALEMIVLEVPPSPDEAPQTEISGTEQVDDKAKKAMKKMRRHAQLLAMYGGASVVVPFQLFGKDNGAGKRWQQIIRRQISVSRFANAGTKDAPTEDEMKQMGIALFQQMFPPEVRLLYDQARYRERSRKLNVVFTSMIPWVSNLPWEFAFDEMLDEYVSVTDVRFVRGVLTPVASDRIERRVGSPLRILLVTAQPSDQVKLDLTEEISRIRVALSDLEKLNLVSIENVDRPTVEGLHDAVRESQYGEIDVVHFMGHGDFDEEKREGCLLFENPDGTTHKVFTEHLCAILRSRGIKVVFLNACQTAQGGFDDTGYNHNKGVAPGLVAGGIPAAVANQYSVFDSSAVNFAQVFYRSLAQGLALGDASREARISLRFSNPNSKVFDWGVPVLFTRNPDAVLCSRR